MVDWQACMGGAMDFDIKKLHDLEQLVKEQLNAQHIEESQVLGILLYCY